MIHPTNLPHPEHVKTGDILFVFDPIHWNNKDVGDNSQFWHLARIEKVYHTKAGHFGPGGEEVADVYFFYSERFSYGHFTNCMTVPPKENE